VATVKIKGIINQGIIIVHVYDKKCAPESMARIFAPSLGSKYYHSENSATGTKRFGSYDE